MVAEVLNAIAAHVSIGKANLETAMAALKALGVQVLNGDMMLPLRPVNYEGQHFIQFFHNTILQTSLQALRCNNYDETLKDNGSRVKHLYQRNIESDQNGFSQESQGSITLRQHKHNLSLTYLQPFAGSYR